jgi:hypothetical protein
MTQPHDPEPKRQTQWGPGEERLRAAIRAHRRQARKEDPHPYDDDWGWWIEQRLSRLETQTKWLIGLAAGALAAEAIRIAFQALGLGP